MGVCPLAARAAAVAAAWYCCRALIATAAAAGLAVPPAGEADVGGDVAEDGLERRRWAWCGWSAMGGVGVAEGGPRADAEAPGAGTEEAGLLRLLPALPQPGLSEGWPGGV